MGHGLACRVLRTLLLDHDARRVPRIPTASTSDGARSEDIHAIGLARIDISADPPRPCLGRPRGEAVAYPDRGARTDPGIDAVSPCAIRIRGHSIRQALGSLPVAPEAAETISSRAATTGRVVIFCSRLQCDLGKATRFVMGQLLAWQHLWSAPSRGGQSRALHCIPGGGGIRWVISLRPRQPACFRPRRARGADRPNHAAGARDVVIFALPWAPLMTMEVLRDRMPARPAIALWTVSCCFSPHDYRCRFCFPPRPAHRKLPQRSSSLLRAAMPLWPWPRG